MLCGINWFFFQLSRVQTVQTSSADHNVWKTTPLWQIHTYYSCMSPYIYIHTHVHMHTLMYAYLHTYIHAYIHLTHDFPQISVLLRFQNFCISKILEFLFFCNSGHSEIQKLQISEVWKSKILEIWEIRDPEIIFICREMCMNHTLCVNAWRHMEIHEIYNSRNMKFHKYQNYACR